MEVDGTVKVIQQRRIKLEWAVSICETCLWSGLATMIIAELFHAVRPA